MKHPLLLLATADAAAIRHLLDHGTPGSGIPPTSRTALERLLARSEIGDDPATRNHHVGLGDRVTLVNPDDATDWYRMEIVLPSEADIEQERISICHPMSLAVLGRPIDELAEWDTGHGLRRMRIVALEQAVLERT